MRHVNRLRPTESQPRDGSSRRHLLFRAHFADPVSEILRTSPGRACRFRELSDNSVTRDTHRRRGQRRSLRLVHNRDLSVRVRTILLRALTFPDDCRATFANRP